MTTPIFARMGARQNVSATADLNHASEPVTITDHLAPGKPSITLSGAELLDLVESYAKAKADHVPF